MAEHDVLAEGGIGEAGRCLDTSSRQAAPRMAGCFRGWQRDERLGIRAHDRQHDPVLGAVIFGIVALVRYLGRSGEPPEAPPPPHSPAPPQAPEQLLAGRFARGEINEEEYRHRLAVLRGKSRPTNGQARPPAGMSTR